MIQPYPPLMKLTRNHKELLKSLLFLLWIHEVIIPVKLLVPFMQKHLIAIPLIRKIIKKNADSNSNSASDSSGKNCVLRISDVTPNCKVDGWCDSGLDTGSRDRVSSNVFSNVASTYTSSNKAGKSPTLNKNTSLNSKLKTDKVPIQSTVIALVDLDNDSNYDSSDGSKKLRRKIKRTRLSSFAKPLISGKTNESQIADAPDDEEQIPPMKKSIRTQLTPPPPSSQTTQLEKFSSGTIS